MPTAEPLSLRVHRVTARVVLAILSAAYVWVVAWITLRTRPYGSDIGEGLNRLLAWFAQHSSTQWITFNLVEFAANIAMFVPLGVIVVLWFGVRGWWVAPLVGVAASVAIELLQSAFLSGTRVADPRDVLANTTGAIVGMLLMLLLAFLLSPPRRRT